MADDRFPALREQLERYLVQNGLKHTRQRELILEEFLESRGHITSEQLHERVRARHADIGTATVYRTLKLLVDAGIASSSTFREGVTVYEHEDCHHDHLICLGCADVVEFKSDVIEREQLEIVEHHGYRLTRHRHHLYGYCPACQEAGRDRKG